MKKKILTYEQFKEKYCNQDISAEDKKLFLEEWGEDMDPFMEKMYKAMYAEYLSRIK
jgi:hypothetical protein